MYALALSLLLVVVVSSASRSCLDFPAITDYKPNKPFSLLKLFLLELFTTAIETNQGTHWETSDGVGIVYSEMCY